MKSLCLLSVHFVTAKLYLSDLPFGVERFMSIWFYQFLSAFIYFLSNYKKHLTLKKGKQKVQINPLIYADQNTFFANSADSDETARNWTESTLFDILLAPYFK